MMAKSEGVSEMTIYEMLGKPAPTIDENTIAAFRGALEAAAITAASAAGELTLSMLDAKEQGHPFQPTPDLVDDFKTSIVELDKSWRSFVRGTQKAAGPVVNSVITAYWGADFAAAIEAALEGYWRA